jgi:hypothetical protein
MRTAKEYYEYRDQKLNDLYDYFIHKDEEEIPPVAHLMCNYPNPFNPQT